MVQDYLLVTLHVIWVYLLIEILSNKCLGKTYAAIKVTYSYCRSFLNLRLRIKLLLCDTLVLCLFNYCDSVYGVCLDSVQKIRSQRVQNSCLWMYLGVARERHISPSTVTIKMAEYGTQTLYTLCFSCLQNCSFENTFLSF